MNIKEIVLRFLDENNTGQIVDLRKVLLKFDNERSTIVSVLHNLEKDKIIEIDRDFRKANWKSRGQCIPLTQINLKARLIPFGEKYFMDSYTTNNRIKIDIGQLQNIQDSIINAPVSQSSESGLTNSFKTLNKPADEDGITNKGKISNNIIYPVIAGVILIIIGLILKYGFGITY